MPESAPRLRAESLARSRARIADPRHCGLAAGLLVLFSAPAWCQELLTITDAAGTSGSTQIIQVEMTSTYDLLGWSFGVCSDPLAVTIESAALATPIASLVPEFSDVKTFADGVTCGVLLSYDPLETLPPPIGLSVLDIEVTLAGAAGTATSVSFCETLGTPPVAVVLSMPYPPYEVFPVEVSGTIEILPDPAPVEFVRADCNGDSGFNIADPVRTLEVLFLAAGPNLCDDACDSNDDGTINIADAVRSLEALFLGGSIPAPVVCGPDPTADSLDCATTPCP